jgi:hypothetical protein
MLLLGAMLLYTGGVALEPLVHGVSPLVPDPAAEVQVSDAATLPDPAGEHECELCRLARTPASFVAPSPSSALKLERQPCTHIPGAAPCGAPTFPSSQPRAPPLS